MQCWRAAAALIVATIAGGCAETAGPAAPVEEIGVFYADPWEDPAYPPRLGSVAAVIDGTAAGWETFDFSVGAFDASAWFMKVDEAVVLTVNGYPDGNPRAEDGLIRIAATFGTAIPAAGTVTQGFVSIVDDRAWDTPRLRGPVTVTVDTIRRDAATSGYGDLTARLAGEICAAAGGDCREITGTITTRFQYDGL